jgi:hypothetical protein
LREVCGQRLGGEALFPHPVHVQDRSAFGGPADQLGLQGIHLVRLVCPEVGDVDVELAASVGLLQQGYAGSGDFANAGDERLQRA